MLNRVFEVVLKLVREEEPAKEAAIAALALPTLGAGVERQRGDCANAGSSRLVD